MKSEKMTPLLQSMWLQVLWILWTLWFVLDPAWDLFASGVEWLLSMGVLGWFLGLVALALAVSLFRTYGPAGGILSIMATFLLLWGIGDGLPGALPGLDLGGGPVVLQKISPGGNVKRRARRSSLCSPFCVWRQPGSGAEGRDMV